MPKKCLLCDEELIRGNISNENTDVCTPCYKGLELTDEELEDIRLMMDAQETLDLGDW